MKQKIRFRILGMFDKDTEAFTISTPYISFDKFYNSGWYIRICFGFFMLDIFPKEIDE